MKKIVFILLVCLAIFAGLIYWSISSTDKNFGTCEIAGLENLSEIDFKAYDSVLVSANVIYEGDVIKQFMQGEQYRDAWAASFKVPIAYLDTLKGGMIVMEEGGGKQTHSLDLQAKDGLVYTMRSISKNPEPLIPEIAKNLGLENIIVDGVSAQHPYAALVVAKLAESVDIMSTRPMAIFVPKQPVLDSLNPKYGNRLFLLEHETEGPATWTGIEHADRIYDTEALQEFHFTNPGKVSIDKSALVRARMFDLLIGDWDRHAKQWGWILIKKDGGFSALPLPCDRDNAFFNIEGLLPTLIANEKFLPKVQQFHQDIDNLPGLVNPFDAYFLKEVPKEVFLQEATALQEMLTDQAISASFQVWPQSLFQLDGEEIIAKIKARRTRLPEFAERFHKILSEREFLTEPLKGSDDLNLSNEELACFDCVVQSKYSQK